MTLPDEGPWEEPDAVDHEDSEEKPEELAEQPEVVAAVPNEALGVEDEERPPEDGEEHGEAEGGEDGAPARGLQTTQHLSQPAADILPLILLYPYSVQSSLAIPKITNINTKQKLYNNCTQYFCSVLELFLS